MIEWLAPSAVALGLGLGWWRERRQHREELRTVSDWLQNVLAGKVPSGPHYSDTAAMLAIGADVTKVASHIETIRRDQSAEEANLQTILASMAEGVMVVDAQHIIRLANPSSLRIFELRTNPVGRSVLHALRDVAVEEVVTSTIKNEQPRQFELTLSHTKPVRHLAITATAIRDASGEVAVLLISHDVTRLKQLEDVRREFVANVSHELRTPLSIFQGYLENLIDYPDLTREELVETLDILKKHSSRLNALVEDLLVLARLESRTDTLVLAPLDACKFVKGIVADWTIVASKKDIRVLAECCEGPIVFEADAFRLEQVLNNLIDNAVKYTERGGEVVVSTRCVEDQVEIRVSDNGIGILPQDLGHIFERFYRADKARSREQGGTGLGLSIVKHIVSKHGGSVRAESRYREGTTIIMCLPLRADKAGAASAAEPRSEVQASVDRAEDQSEPHLVK